MRGSAEDRLNEYGKPQPTSTPSDAGAIEAVLSGDREAFGILVRRYHGPMVAYARYTGLGNAEAHDVVQEGFLRAYRNLDRCGDRERFEGWLFMIVRNLSRSALTRRSRRETLPIDLLRHALRDDGPAPDESALARALEGRVRRALGTIPEEQREALALMYFLGHSVREIASLTDATESAVKMRLKRGREALRDVLEPIVSETTDSRTGGAEATRPPSTGAERFGRSDTGS